MADAPLVVEPHVQTIGTQVDKVVGVFTARNPCVEGNACECLGMNGETATAHRVAARNSGASQRLGHPLVEFEALGPMAVVEVHTTAIGESGVAMVEEVARLGNDRRSHARLRTQTIHSLCQELGVKDNFVIIDKHRDVAP